MSDCGRTDPATPALKLHMTDRGEDAMRKEKRLRCTGRALGLDVQVDWDASGFGAPHVTVENRLGFPPRNSNRCYANT